MKEISDLLTQSLKRHGIERQVTAVRVVEAGHEILQHLLSSPAKPDVRVISFFGDVLRVACRHPAAAQEVRRVTDKVLIDLARAFPSRTIRDIEVRIDERPFQEPRE